jgi:YggT family protein
VAAWLLVLLKFLVLWALMGALERWAILPLVSLIGLLQLTVSGLTALLIVYAVLSWVPSASSMLHDLIARLAERFRASAATLLRHRELDARE